jgi:hypothetical protein
MIRLNSRSSADLASLSFGQWLFDFRFREIPAHRSQNTSSFPRRSTNYDQIFEQFSTESGLPASDNEVGLDGEAPSIRVGEL